MTSPTQRRQQGFSLIEVIMVVAVTLVIATMATSGFTAIRNSYNVSTSARGLTSSVQLARSKAVARNTRYRLTPDTSTQLWIIEFCSNQNASTRACDGWSREATDGRGQATSPTRFTAGGITTVPPGASAVTQATEVTFNSRGLLVDTSGNAIASKCFYLQGGGQSWVTCTNLTGKTSLYRLSGSAWQQQ